MDPPAAEAVAALPPHQRRRRGARSVELTLFIAISVSILSLLKLEPLARNSVQGHKSEIDLNGTAFRLCTDYVLLRNLGYLR